MVKNTQRFEGFAEMPAEVVRRNYNVLSGSLAEDVRKVAETTFGARLAGFPGLEGTLRIVDAQGREELAGSNMPVLAGLNLVDLGGLGIQVCDERDLARIYNDEVTRLEQGREGFFNGRYWFDVALIRNPHATQKELAPWEAELDKGISKLCGKGEIVSVPYRAIVPVVTETDNAPFGKISCYSFKLNSGVRDAVRVIEVSAQEAQEGYDFAKLDGNSAFPVKGRGRHFDGISGSKKFSGLCIYGSLDANHDGDPLYSNEYGRVAFKSRSDALEK
ncbi:MAG: hypothetical protein KKD18_01180 [Nanoarchaeota archaeon]|nr:hypothetical protein [Nanoarchaeota archaeon]MBU0977006.1 hypothetical protein [Nanoarchaeota archaeon]